MNLVVRDRRVFLGGALTAAFAPNLFAAGVIHQMGFERGDPAGPQDPAFLSPTLRDVQVEPDGKEVIPDLNPYFGRRLIQVAAKFVGVNRWDSTREQVRTILELFDCPFSSNVDGTTRFTAFCAAGIGYCGTLVYGENAKNLSDLKSLRRIVDFYHFWPSSAVRDMAMVAQGKKRWIPNDGRTITLKPGWIVCFNWGKGGGVAQVDHCGLVESASNNEIVTIEFNTSGAASGSQRDGGVVARRRRPINATVRGYIDVDSV